MNKKLTQLIIFVLAMGLDLCICAIGDYQLIITPQLEVPIFIGVAGAIIIISAIFGAIDSLIE
jgi:hypothetical protein